MFTSKYADKLHYATAVGLVTAAGLIAWLLPALQEVVPVLFVAPVILTAWLGGVGPGLLATVLAAVALDYYILEPRFVLELTSPRNILNVAVFALVAMVTSGLAEKRRRAERESRRLAEQLQEADRHKDDFLAVLAHEIRNSLSPLQISSQMIQMLPASQTDEDLQLASRTIENQVRHLARLIDDLLDISRVRTGKIQLHKERVELNELAERAHAACEPLCSQRGHTLELARAKEPVYLDVDPVRMQQVLVNLLSNAAKYTDPPGEIRLTVARSGNEALLRVEDNGVGLPPERISQIFELFMQLDSSLNRSQGGLGIGLSLVRRLVELHGGTVAAESEGLGRGSRFTVRLPMSLQPSAPEPAAVLQTADVANRKPYHPAESQPSHRVARQPR